MARWLPGVVAGRKVRAQRLAAWREQRDRLEAAQNANKHAAIVRATEAEQTAWDDYADACADINECADPDCSTEEFHHMYCPAHRPK
jgi:hypothetical protein